MLTGCKKIKSYAFYLDDKVIENSTLNYKYGDDIEDVLDDVENIEKTYVHNHSVTYRTIKSGIVDTTGHIELISPSSSTDATMSSFYMKNNKTKVTVAYNSIGSNANQTIEKEYYWLEVNIC